MNDFAVAVWLSLVSVVCYAAAAVVQQRLAASLPASVGFLGAIRQRRWWIAVGLTCVGATLHVAALRFGPLTVVQPLGTLTLVLALPLGAAVTGRRVSTAERRGAAATVVGLGGLLLLTAAAAPVHALSTQQSILVGGATIATILALVVVGSRTSQPTARALLYACGAGIASGVASGLAQTVLVRVTQHGIAAAVDPAVALVVCLATMGLLLSQAAYRGSGLGAPLAMSTLANPVAAGAIGLLLLGEARTTGLVTTFVAVLAALAAGYGVALLTRAPTDHPVARTDAVPARANCRRPFGYASGSSRPSGARTLRRRPPARRR